MMPGFRKKKTLNKERKKAGRPPLLENRWAQLLGMVITFHVVMVSFLIFSGFLNDLWFIKIRRKLKNGYQIRSY